MYTVEINAMGGGIYILVSDSYPCIYQGFLVIGLSGKYSHYNIDEVSSYHVETMNE